jgi:hypothetical protein
MRIIFEFLAILVLLTGWVYIVKLIYSKKKK